MRLQFRLSFGEGVQPEPIRPYIPAPRYGRLGLTWAQEEGCHTLAEYKIAEDDEVASPPNAPVRLQATPPRTLKTNIGVEAASYGAVDDPCFCSSSSLISFCLLRM